MARRSKTHFVILPAGEPSSWEAKSTRMTSHFRGLLLPEAMRPFFKPPCITMLPGEEEVVRKAKNERDTNFLASLEPMQKGAFEHGMNTNGKEEDTL